MHPGRSTAGEFSKPSHFQQLHELSFWTTDHEKDKQHTQRCNLDKLFLESTPDFWQFVLQLSIRFRLLQRRIHGNRAEGVPFQTTKWTLINYTANFGCSERSRTALNLTKAFSVILTWNKRTRRTTKRGTKSISLDLTENWEQTHVRQRSVR